MNKEKQNGLNLGMLIAVIIGSTIASGIFSSVADMAAKGAHTGAVLTGWAIAGVGMFALMMSFAGLNKLRPDLVNGVYSYASEGFGMFIGFNSAWGYWISALLCNVSYVALFFGALGYFFPVFGAGNNLISIVAGSVAIWICAFLVIKGVKEAAALQLLVTISKIIPLIVFALAIVFVKAFKPDVFMANFWGDGSIPVMDQIKATTGATVWSFIGVEGAVVLSGRAKKSSDVGKATVLGFIGLLAIYVMIAALSLGVMPAEEMAALGNPPLAFILKAAVGEWGAALINIGVILSLAGALLGWTIIAAECAYSASVQGVFTKLFAKSNANEAPVASAIITNAVIQVFLVIMLFSEGTYQLFYNFSASMIMLPYLLSGAYYAKVTTLKLGMEGYSAGRVALERFWGYLATIYGVWMIYSAGLMYLLVTAILYALGILVYAYGQKEYGRPIFQKGYEAALAVVFVILGAISVYLLASGSISL